MKIKTERVSEIVLLLTSMVGKPIEEAIQLAGFNGFSTRIVREDGNIYIVTQELRHDRINLEIDSKIVTRTFLG